MFVAKIRLENEVEVEHLNAEARNLARRMERAIVNQTFDRFLTWYRTIAPVEAPTTQVVVTLANHLKLEDEITNSANSEVRRNLHKLIDEINYRNTDFDRNEIISQTIDRYVYSQAFKANRNQ